MGQYKARGKDAQDAAGTQSAASRSPAVQRASAAAASAGTGAFANAPPPFGLDGSLQRAPAPIGDTAIIQPRKGAGKIKRKYTMPDEAKKHIFEGDIKKGTKLSGFHSIKGGVAYEVTNKVDGAKGIYAADVRAKIGDRFYPTGGYKRSTMFPDSWSKADVVDAIEMAFTDPTKASRGTGPDRIRLVDGKPFGRAWGINIKGIRSGTLKTAFPLMSGEVDGDEGE